LTSRSDDRTSTYQMPATDVVNGKARAFIPADTLIDPNGYRLRVVGTRDGEPVLLATGTVAPMAAAGFGAVPEDTIDTIPLTFERNEDASLNVKLWDDTSKTNPFELTDTGVNASVYSAKGGIVLVPFTVTVVAVNEVTLSLTAAQVNSLPDSCWWSMAALTVNGSTTLAEGTVTVTGTVIPELPETIASYAYVKPATLDNNPANGQIFHNTITQNILKVAKLAQASLDLTAVLALVKAGDEIVIGATTWTVGLTYEASAHFEFKVSPVSQSATTGVTPVTFRRPAPV
jgi:hypothetical protein